MLLRKYDTLQLYHGELSYNILLLDDTQLETVSLLSSFEHVEHAMHDTRKKKEKQLFFSLAVNSAK